MLTHTHIAGAMALCAGAALAARTPPEEILPVLLVGAAGGVLPDVDLPHSRAAQVLALLEGGALGMALGWALRGEILPAALGGLAGCGLGGIGIVLLLVALLWAPAPGQLPALAALGVASLAGLLARSRAGRRSLLSTTLHVTGGHRGPTHSLAFLAAAGAVGLLLGAAVAWWALPLGVLSHLALDSLTWSGVPWLWPWGRRFRARWALHTGSWVENLAVFPLLALAALGMVALRA